MLHVRHKMPAVKLWRVDTTGINAIKNCGFKYITRGKELSMRDKRAEIAEIALLGLLGIGIFVYGLYGLIKAFKRE